MLQQIILIFEQAVTSVVALVHSLGYLGIFISMAVESSIIPVPSEAILIPAGILILQGKMSFALVFLSALAGSLVGSLICYALALYLGRAAVNHLISRYGKFIFLDAKSMKKTDDFFKKHGSITIFTGRLILVVRHLISLPAGFAKMNLFKFCIYTSLGAGVWSLILIGFGYFFGALSPAGKFGMTLLILAIVLLIILIYLICQSKRKSKKYY